LRIYLPILIILSAFILFYHLGERPFLSSGEARAGEIALEMLNTGNFIVPYLNEEIILTKPPLFHWLIIACYKIFGVSEFSSRFISALAGILVVVFTYLLGKKFWGEKTGFISGLILLTSPIFFWSARCARIDSLLLLFITISMYCFWRGYELFPKSKKWFLLWFLCMGLGTVAKGQIALAAPLIIVILFLLFTNKRSYISRLSWLWGIILFIVVTAPWFVAVYFLVPKYKAELFFLQQHGAWFAGGQHNEWYKGYVYIPHLFLGFLPWSLVLPLAFVTTWQGFRKKDDKTIFLWLWSIVIFCIFFFFGKKVSRYILPMYPAVSLLMAYVITKRNISRMFLWALVILWAGFIAAVFGFGMYQRFIDPEAVSLIIKYINNTVIVIVGFLMILSGLYGIRQSSFAVSVIMVFISLIMFVKYFIPVEKDYYSPKPFCEMMKKEVLPGGIVRAYNSWDNTIRYYFGRHVDVMRNESELVDFLNSNDKVYCFMWNKVYENLPDEIKNKMFIIGSNYKVLENKVVFVSNKPR
jgi:4-amino-4-deoxy-L-arabinose transferase-like glycosyltransferase